MIQYLDLENDDRRVESGVVAFSRSASPAGGGYDWPGVFWRGDNASGVACELRYVARKTNEAGLDVRLAQILNDIADQFEAPVK